MTRWQKGFFIVLLTSIMWALSGNMGSYLFKHSDMTPQVLTSFRLLGGGLCLLGLCLYEGLDIFSIWKIKRNIYFLFLYGIGGLFIMQYGFFTCVNYANAPTACLLQYCGVFFVIFYASVVMKIPPRKVTKIALPVTVVGVILLLTKGDLDSLNISMPTLITGLLAMLGYTISNLAPISLTSHYPPKIVAAWAMCIGGVAMTLVNILGQTGLPDLQGFSYFALFYCVVFGTALPFAMYLSGQKVVGPTVASLLGLSESLFSAIISLVWLKEIFTVTDLLGMVCVLFGVILMSLPEKKPGLVKK